MNLSSTAENLVQVSHLIQFDESMSNPTNEPKWEPCTKIGVYVGPSHHMLQISH
jgi:hypothetical protein